MSSKIEIKRVCEYCGNDFPWKSKKAQVKSNIKSNNKDDVFLIETLMDRFQEALSSEDKCLKTSRLESSILRKDSLVAAESLACAANIASTPAAWTRL